MNEILDFLQIKPGQKGLDATFGYGGHTRKMLEKLEGDGHMYALDIDPIEIKKTTGRLRDAGYGEDILTVKHATLNPSFGSPINCPFATWSPTLTTGVAGAPICWLIGILTSLVTGVVSSNGAGLSYLAKSNLAASL